MCSIILKDNFVLICFVVNIIVPTQDVYTQEYIFFIGGGGVNPSNPPYVSAWLVPIAVDEYDFQ